MPSVSVRITSRIELKRILKVPDSEAEKLKSLSWGNKPFGRLKGNL